VVCAVYGNWSAAVSTETLHVVVCAVYGNWSAAVSTENEQI